jgi:peptide/nickel transport system permease protein
VLLRHALRTSLATFVAALFSDFASVLGSALAIDYVFKLNGLGTVFISQFPRTFGTVDPNSMTPVLLLAAVYVLVASILADVAVVWLDPRVRGAR